MTPDVVRRSSARWWRSKWERVSGTLELTNAALAFAHSGGRIELPLTEIWSVYFPNVLRLRFGVGQLQVTTATERFVFSFIPGTGLGSLLNAREDGSGWEGAFRFVMRATISEYPPNT